MKETARSSAWSPAVPLSVAAQLLELSFSVLSVLTPFFVTFFPSLQPAPQNQDLYEVAGVAPLIGALLPSLDQPADSPLLPEPEQLGATGLSAVASESWTCAQQMSSGLLLPSYPCGGSALEQAAHFVRSPTFYLFIRPIMLGDWIWVVWVLSHALIAAANTALLVMGAVGAIGPAAATPAAVCSPAEVSRADPWVHTISGGSASPNNNVSDGQGSGGEPLVRFDSSRGSAVCDPRSADATHAANEQPRSAVVQEAVGAAPGRHWPRLASAALRLLKAWSVLREPLLLVASPCKCGFASLVYLCGWLAARGMGVDERRRRWVLLSAHNNGMAAARHPHLVALLGLLSLVCQPVRQRLLVRSCLASMASCMALSLASAALGLPPWDSAAREEPPLAGLALALAVIRAHLPAYAFAYLTAPLCLYVGSHLQWMGTLQTVVRLLRGSGSRHTRLGGQNPTLVHGMAGAEEQPVVASSSKALGPAGRARRSTETTRRRTSAGVRSGTGSLFRLAAGDLGGELTGSVTSGPPSGSGGSSLRQLSPAPSTALRRLGTPAASLPWRDGQCGSETPTISPPASRAPSMPLLRPDHLASELAPAATPTYGMHVPLRTAASTPCAAPSGTTPASPAHSRHTRALGHNDRTGAAYAAAPAAAAAAAALLGPPRGPGAAAGSGAEASAAGAIAASVGGGGGGATVSSPLYRSRLPNSNLVMSCKFRVPTGMTYAAASGALRSVAKRCMREAAAATRAAAAVAGEVPGSLLSPAASGLSVECLTLPGCVQLVIVVEGPDEAGPRSSMAGKGSEGTGSTGSGAASAAVSRSRLPSWTWLRPGALWAAVARAAEGLGMRRLTVPRVQCVASEAEGGRGDVEQGLEQAVDEEGEEAREAEQGEGTEATFTSVEVGRPRAPALLYTEPPVLSAATLATALGLCAEPDCSEGCSGIASGSASGANWDLWVGEQQEAFGQGVAAPGLVVDMYVPPDLLQDLCDDGQEQEQQLGAAGSPPRGRRSQGGSDERWRLVAMATATHAGAASPPPPILLYPAAAAGPASDPPTASSLHSSAAKNGLPTPARRLSLSSPTESAAACRPPPAGLLLRLRLTPDALRRIGVLPDNADPPARCFAPRPLWPAPTPATMPSPSPTPTPTPSTLTASCASTSPSATSHAPAATCHRHAPCLGARQWHCAGAVNSALLQLHLLAVPRDAQLSPPYPLTPATPGRQMKQRNSSDSGFSSRRSVTPLEATEVHEGSAGGSRNPPPGGDGVWSGSNGVAAAAAASRLESPAESYTHSLPQAVWLGSAPLLLAPPGPAGELAALWERMKGEVEAQGQEGRDEGEEVSGAAGRYLASSGLAMQHHMRPLLRDLAAAVTLAVGQGAEDTGHVRAFLQSQGMGSCVEWMDGEGSDGACWVGSSAAGADPLDTPPNSSSSSRSSLSGSGGASGGRAAALPPSLGCSGPAATPGRGAASAAARSSTRRASGHSGTLPGYKAGTAWAGLGGKARDEYYACLRRSSTYTLGEHEVVGNAAGVAESEGVALRVGKGTDVSVDARGRRGSSDSAGRATALRAVVCA